MDYINAEELKHNYGYLHEDFLVKMFRFAVDSVDDGRKLSVLNKTALDKFREVLAIEGISAHQRLYLMTELNNAVNTILDENRELELIDNALTLKELGITKADLKLAKKLFD